MMMAAFTDRKTLLNAYHEAISHRYRFFSYGDCMLIL
jgi:S-adenosylmethionine:tRNA ribosyltransferase-isomerase